MMRSVVMARYWKQRDKAAKDIQRAFKRYKQRKARKAYQQATPRYKSTTPYMAYMRPYRLFSP